MIDRKQLKLEAKGLMRTGKVSAYQFALVYLLLSLLLRAISSYVTTGGTRELLTQFVKTGFDLSVLLLQSTSPSALAVFVALVASLTGLVLDVGMVLYTLGIRRGETMPLKSLFDGFSFAGKIILLNVVRDIFIFLWSLLFVVPGIIAAYRYRFAIINLCENPDIGIMEAISMSKEQTKGFKWQLFVLDLSFLGWQILCALTVGILSIWVAPYVMQTEVGYYRQIKSFKDAASLPDQTDDGRFRPQDPFGGTNNG